jgi:D-alanyl-D-alanine carboxypeptidase
MNLWLPPRIMCTLLAVVLAAPSPPATAQPAPMRSEANAALSEIVAADYTSTRVQSVVFGAWIGRSPLLKTALGDTVTGVPASTAMHIRPGIVETEALNTMLVELADQQRVSLDTPLARCFPRLPRAHDVTFRMLGNNRSGYGDYLADESLLKRLNDNPFQTFAPNELIAIGMHQPRPFKAGQGFLYAHTNAVLLGAALQCLTGKSIAALIDEMIVGPLHLSQTAVPDSADVPEPAQHLFYRDRGVFEESTYWNPSWASFSGTILSTLDDVAIMQRAFGSGRLVSKRGLAQILAPTNAHTPPQSKDFYFGLGVIVGDTWILQHAQVAGSDVVMGYLPERDLTIVVSTAISFTSVPNSHGYSLSFFKDAAAYLAPERPVPSMFTKN